MKAVFGVDPGGTTGVALVEVADRIGLTPGQYNQTTILTQFRRRLDLALKHFHGQVEVAIERYDIRPGLPLSDTSTLTIISELTQLLRGRGVRYRLQHPSQVKGFWTNPRLRALGMLPNNSRHAWDATRHALAYLCATDREAAQRIYRMLGMVERSVS